MVPTVRSLSRVSLLLVAAVVLVAAPGCLQRRLLYFPEHADVSAASARAGFSRWEIDGEYTGYARNVASPERVVLFLHGNGGQAGGRGYIVSHVARTDAVFVLEYPGYGQRDGSPSRTSFDAAALKAYTWLVRTYGAERLVVIGESLGTGPASQLARAPTPPRHIVLLVPFDVLENVAKEKFTYLPVGLLMVDRWNNIEALKGYTGRLDIFAAAHDEVIPVEHARKLAAAIPGARYHEFDGTHSWGAYPQIDLVTFSLAGGR